MKLLALLAIALSLLSATAADARCRHCQGMHAHHGAMPLPRSRPVLAVSWLPREPSHSVVADAFAAFGWR